MRKFRYKISLSLAIFMTSCTPMKKYLSGYKDNITYNKKDIQRNFERDFNNSTSFYKGDDPKFLINILNSFSNTSTGTVKFTLPLPVVFDRTINKFINHRPTGANCDAGFEYRLKSIDSIEAYNINPIDYSQLTKEVLGLDELDVEERYILFIFWTQKTYRANRTNMKQWSEISDRDNRIRTYFINVDLVLFFK